MNSLSLPVIHPAFENLKKNGQLLHLSASILIFANAVHEFKVHDIGAIYFWAQMIIGIDIFLLAIMGKNFLEDAPRYNLAFRFMEVVIFLSFSWMYIIQLHYIMAVVMLLISGGYAYIFYCERKGNRHELLSFHHIGVEIPDLPSNHLLSWYHINEIKAEYDNITINVSGKKYIRLWLKKNLHFEELEQIHEFCRHYLKTS
ncbi:MAG TPA: hypothetical protein VFN30_11645 [Chitinophagaceae bacterium]|nr:hypothetical protein [Chitinophagaceae bacterium]